MAVYQDGKQFPLLPYYGLASDGCSDVISVRPRGSQEIVLRLQTLRNATPGTVEITFKAIVGASDRGPWLDLSYKQSATIREP